MPQAVIQLSALKPLGALRLRTSGAYRGTVTEPGALVSDGRIIFPLARVPAAARPLAETIAGLPLAVDHAPVAQARARQTFEKIAQAATRPAELLGQIEKPLWIPAAETDNVAVLRFGRGARARYAFVNAHRLLLLRELTQADEIRCAAPHAPVLLCRKGKPVGGLTALHVEPEVKP